MGDYAPPIGALLKMGEPARLQGESDYLALGFGPAHVPELIRLLQDDDLSQGAPDTPEVYAQVHAWRALGQLRAPEAIEPLLDLLAEQGLEDWDDWITEGVPDALGQIGPAAIPAVVARLHASSRSEYLPSYYANALVAVAERFPETRSEVINHLCHALRTVSHHPTTNGFIVSDLISLGAKESLPVIEVAFALGNVDEGIAGDVAMVKYSLGLGPLPPASSRGGWSLPGAGSNARQRFNARQRKKTAEKKKNKKRK
ncbi:MAG: HEAT repeat domain-containing protein [Gemmata sp.]